MSTKDWAKPIPLKDYASFVTEPAEKGGFSPVKDSASPSGYRLRAKVRMTFAGLRTKNRAIYLPDEMYKGLSSWVHPFPKPIITNHNIDGADPVGRVIDVRYVDTTNAAAEVDKSILSVMAKFRDKTSKKTERLATIPTLLKLSESDKYRGVGHILGLWDISEEAAIQKVVDRRYLTVSTSFTPKGAYCSACALEGKLTDWKDSSCDHERGEVYDGVECVAVPHGFEYAECSFVNEPAAVYAQVLETGTSLSFEDASARARLIPYEIFSDLVIGSEKEAFRCSDSVKVDLPERLPGKRTSPLQNTKTTDSSPQTVPEKEEGKGMLVKLFSLTRDAVENYDVLSTHLPEGAARLSGDLLSEVEDSCFAGPNRTFLVRDEAHCKAAIALLETVEDSGAKDEILGTVTARLASFTKTEDTTEETVEEAAPVEDVKEETEEKVDDSVHGDLAKEAASAIATLVSKIATATDARALEEAVKGLDDIWDLVHSVRKAMAVVSQMDASERTPEKLEGLISSHKGEAAKVEESLQELDALKVKVEEALAERDVYKHKTDYLKAEAAVLSAQNAELLKDQKASLAEKLLDAQIALGFKITDREEKLKELSKRSIPSLRDSLNDIVPQKKVEDGIANSPTGESAPNPLSPEAKTQDTVTTAPEVDTSKFAHIVDRYYDLFYGPEGRRGADSYLNTMKRRGLVPPQLTL